MYCTDEMNGNKATNSPFVDGSIRHGTPLKEKGHKPNNMAVLVLFVSGIMPNLPGTPSLSSDGNLIGEQDQIDNSPSLLNIHPLRMNTNTPHLNVYLFLFS